MSVPRSDGFTRTILDEHADGGRTLLRHWLLIGEIGAVQVSFMKLPDEWEHDPETFPGGWTGADFAYHTPFPQYAGHQQRTCDLLDDGHCFAAGSSLPAQPLLAEWWKADCDDEVIWRAAELAYRAKFLDGLHGEPSFDEKAQLLADLLDDEADQ